MVVKWRLRCCLRGESLMRISRSSSGASEGDQEDEGTSLPRPRLTARADEDICDEGMAHLLSTQIPIRLMFV
jgi:hypothetical protein